MEFKKLLPIIFCISVVALAMISGLTRAQATDNVSINITIASFSQITVTPADLNWTNLATGGVGGVLNLTIKNTGSVNVSSMFVFVNTNDTEPVRPYGVDNPVNWSAGNLLVIRNTSDIRFYWGQRKEWNVTADIANIVLSAITPSSRASRGFLRNASFEYVWAVGNGTNSSFPLGDLGCNNTGTIFAITDAADDGSSGTRTPDATGITRDGGDEYFSYFSVTRATAPISNMCVAVHKNCGYILIYKFDRRSGFNTCVNSASFRIAPLNPGQSEDMKADAWVPNGLPSGQLRIAQMTVQVA